MKAAYIERHGGPEVLKFGEIPDPVAGPGGVAVDIVAASVASCSPAQVNSFRGGDHRGSAHARLAFNIIDSDVRVVPGQSWPGPEAFG